MGLSFGQVSCTATVEMRVRKKPASWGCPGQTIFVKSSFQAQKPTAIPIKLAIGVIFRVVMNSPSVRLGLPLRLRWLRRSKKPIAGRLDRTTQNQVASADELNSIRSTRGEHLTRGPQNLARAVLVYCSACAEGPIVPNIP